MPDPTMREVAASVAREHAERTLAPQSELDLAPELDLPPTDKLVALREARGPGRPPGARNKRREATAAALLAHGDPLAELWAMAMAPAPQLMAAGLSLMDALTLKRLAAAEALPYLHQRQPQALTLDLHNLPTLILADPRAFTGAITVSGKSEEIQEVPFGPGDAV